MSDSIEKDEEFMKLVKTREKLEREIAAVFSYEMLLGEYDNDKRLHNLQLEASRARKEIYRYIDRRVERAVLEERAKQPYKPKTLIEDKDRGIDSAWMARQMKILGSILDRDDR